MKELTRRISVALWGIPALIFLSYMGGYYFGFLILIINGMALWEFYSIYENKQIYPYKVAGVIFSTVFLLTVYFVPQYWESMMLLTMIYVFFVFLSSQEGLASKNATFTIVGIVYITLFLSTLLRLRLNFEEWIPVAAQHTSHAGGRFLIVLLASIWICDTAAYAGGKKFGRHKLAPAVSPNKTVEGALFGLVFGVLSFILLGMLFLPTFPLTYSTISGAIVGIFGQIGDLVESRFKRDAGVKDTSSLLPGHGGFLDRFDSLIFVSPFLWALFYYGRF